MKTHENAVNERTNKQTNEFMYVYTNGSLIFCSHHITIQCPSHCTRVPCAYDASCASLMVVLGITAERTDFFSSISRLIQAV